MAGRKRKSSDEDLPEETQEKLPEAVPAPKRGSQPKKVLRPAQEQRLRWRKEHQKKQ